MTDRDGTGWDVWDGFGRVITDRDRFVCMAGQFRVQNWPVSTVPDWLRDIHVTGQLQLYAAGGGLSAAICQL